VIDAHSPRLHAKILDEKMSELIRWKRAAEQATDGQRLAVELQVKESALERAQKDIETFKVRKLPCVGNKA
jgi:hypothetical protein